MAHMKKYKKAAVGRMLDHYDRQPNDGVNRSNENIDPSRTPLNYTLGGSDRVDVWSAIRRAKDRTTEKTSKAVRSDAVLFGDWVITLPEDCPEERAGEFFEHSYRFVQERYGAENVPVGFVHMDETTPHMHVPVIPIEDGRLNAKGVFSRKDLKTFHQGLKDYLFEKGLDVSVLLSKEQVAEKAMSRLTREEMNALQEVAYEAAYDDAREEALKSVRFTLEKQIEYAKELKAQAEQRDVESRSKEEELANRENGLRSREEALKSRQVAYNEAVNAWNEGQLERVQERNSLDEQIAEKKLLVESLPLPDEDHMLLDAFKELHPDEVADLLSEYKQQVKRAEASIAKARRSTGRRLPSVVSDWEYYDNPSSDDQLGL